MKYENRRTRTGNWRSKDRRIRPNMTQMAEASRKENSTAKPDRKVWFTTLIFFFLFSDFQSEIVKPLFELRNIANLFIGPNSGWKPIQKERLREQGQKYPYKRSYKFQLEAPEYNLYFQESSQIPSSDNEICISKQTQRQAIQALRRLRAQVQRTKAEGQV